MKEIQIFQILGLFFFATGVGMLVNPKFIKNILKELETSTASMLYGGIISLFIGYFIVAYHNIWAWNESLIITIIGWLALLKGLALLIFPASAIRVYKNIDKGTYFITWLIIVFGMILLYFGYFA